MILLSINQPKKINSVLEYTNLALPLLAINIGSLQTPFIIPDKKKWYKMRRGGGLYGNFVSASDNVQNKAYRGAEIPPPSCLNSGAPKNNKVVGNSSGRCHW